MNGRYGTTTFLPLDSKIGGPKNHPTVGHFLTREQAVYVYKKVETGKIVNPNMMKQEIEQGKQISSMIQVEKPIHIKNL